MMNEDGGTGSAKGRKCRVGGGGGGGRIFLAKHSGSVKCACVKPFHSS